MKVTIDNHELLAQTGETILDLIIREQMDTQTLATRPLAAKIAGEVFTLNYVPVREEDGASGSTIRRAMRVSNGRIRLLKYSDPAGKDVYTRTACFVVFLAIRELWPECTAKISCTLGNSVYICVNDSAFDVSRLKEKVQEKIDENFSLKRRRVMRETAIEKFTERGQLDKAALLRWIDSESCYEYYYHDFSDYFYGEMLPSTGYLTVWDIFPAKNGFILSYPDDLAPDQPSTLTDMPSFFNVFSEGERWGKLMECETVADLNQLTSTGEIRELIRVNEALHEKRFSQIADTISTRNVKVVMLAGPSSSGKTTSANRLATQLRVYGKKPILMSLDNYYLDRDKILPGPDGKLDLEHINTIDTQLFRDHMSELFRGREVELPKFNFRTGRREWTGKHLRLTDDSVIIVEGIHGLNPTLIPEGMDHGEIFRLYVSPLLPLNLDNHNRIPTSYLRLLRRIVRDFETRGSSVQRTISMWESVRNGEKRWIFPYQENADTILNSSTLYELAVLKQHVYPLLKEIGPEDDCYDDVQAIVKILDYVVASDVDDEIPPTSIVREFIGGNKFYR